MVRFKLLVPLATNQREEDNHDGDDELTVLPGIKEYLAPALFKELPSSHNLYGKNIYCFWCCP
jgi:hypothetical protein